MKLAVPTRSALLDASGHLTREWFNFFQELVQRSGEDGAALASFDPAPPPPFDPRNSLTLNGSQPSLIFKQGAVPGWRLEQSLTTPGGEIAANAYFDPATGTWKFENASSGASLIQQDVGWIKFAWGKVVTGVFSWVIGFVYDVINQRVGIGQNSPLYALDVKGDINVAPDTSTDHPAPGVYRSRGIGGVSAAGVTIDLAKLTPTGFAGSLTITVSAGIVTQFVYVAPT